jgi:hypothetical protein
MLVVKQPGWRLINSFDFESGLRYNKIEVATKLKARESIKVLRNNIWIILTMPLPALRISPLMPKPACRL